MLPRCSRPISHFGCRAYKTPNIRFPRWGDLALSVSSKLRSVGIILLLTEADTDGFLFNLVRGARLWRDYLRRVHDEDATEDHHFCSGRFDPLLDAIAAGHWDLASEITTLTPSVLREGHEYEDDFCFAQLLARMIRQPADDRGEIDGLLDRFEDYLDGEPDARPAVCRALANLDQAEFDETFDDLIQRRQLQIELNKERGQLEEPAVVAQRYVFIEGLAFPANRGAHWISHASRVRVLPVTGAPSCITRLSRTVTT